MLLMGFTLGLLGGGGSILSVPILVYVFKFSAVKATAYSLFIVGCSASVGAIRNYKKRTINSSLAVSLSLPGLLGVYISRTIIIPKLPDVILKINELEVSKNNFILLCFSFLMLIASYSMIFGRKESSKKIRDLRMPEKITMGLLIGVITGFVGAGGGFIIVPVLIYFFDLETKKAIGTSLMVISINSLMGFLGSSLNSLQEIDFELLISLSAIASMGILSGAYLNQFVPAKRLKQGFGFFVVALGIWISYQQLI